MADVNTQSLDLPGLKIFAANLAREITLALDERLKAGREPSALVLLRGPMGAGKTQLARYFIESLSGETEVASPSFALHHRHPTTHARIDHFDLYRLETEEELESIAFWDFFRREKPPVARIALIEWAERLNELGVDGNLPRAWARWDLALAEDGADRRRLTWSKS